MRYPAMCAPVRIDETNNLVMVGAWAGGDPLWRAREIATGTYGSIYDVMAAWTAALALDFPLVTSFASDGKVVGWAQTAYVNLRCQLDWGFDSRTRGLAAILGFDPDAPLEWMPAGQWSYGTRSPQGWWTSDMPVAVDEGDMPDEEEVQTRALSGYRQTSILSPVRRVREVRIDLLLARHMWTRAEVLPGESFESAIWPHRHAIRYFSDRNDPSTGADYVIAEPQGRLRPARYQGARTWRGTSCLSKWSGWWGVGREAIRHVRSSEDPS